MSRTTTRRAPHAGLAVAAAIGVIASLLSPNPATADETLPAADGLTEATAAASCWEIVQRDPQADSGIYWLLTPAMGSAEQFYCDQETDGGGWVLVGRGRERWSESAIGSGTPEQVRTTVTGPAAFSPRQLPSATIDALVNDGRIDELSDGIRLVRAENSSGTQWQEVRIQLDGKRDGWTWQFNSEQPVASYRIGGATGSGGKTSYFGHGSGIGVVRMQTGSAEGWAMGFGYGRDIGGSTGSSSYLWSSTNQYARPFTQVFLRPHLMSDELFSPIPAGGTPASEATPVADAFAMAQPWSVAGLGAGPSSLEGSNEVSAFTESGDNVYVGGNFTSVRRTRGSAGEAQAYLAAFDRDLGEWVSGFRPEFDNQVKALATLPDGRIAAGGYFSTVNGEPHAGLVVLDPETGEVDDAFTGRLINYLSGGVPVVRSLDVQDGWLYAAGSFTHSTSDSGGQAYTRGLARFDIQNDVADAWNPEFNGTVMSVDASDRGDRVYAAGYFGESKGRPALRAAALSSVDDSLIEWSPVFSTGSRSGYQQAVLEVGDRVWLGGSEHILASYDRDTMQNLTTNITTPGGDFQAIASDGQSVYAGCHCFGSSYEGASSWPYVGSSWTEVDAIYGAGAWSAATGERIPSFNGTFNTRAGAGAWALFVDSNGTLWQGGDWSFSTRAGYVRQWSGGFTRHEATDVTAPSTPSDVVVHTTDEGVSLSWSASSDDRAVARYQVLRADRVVATVEGTEAQLPSAPVGTVYAVRAADAAGNVSASTVPVEATDSPDLEPAPVGDSGPLIDEGADWAYLWNADGAPVGWTSAAFDDSAWSVGAAPLGWGTSDIATPLDRDLTPKPITSYYRSSFELVDEDAALTLAVRADDGVVVYIDGVEMLRQHLDEGPVTAHTFANTSVSGSHAAANPIVLDLAAGTLAPGTHTVAVEVHSNYRAANSHSFEMTVTQR